MQFISRAVVLSCASLALSVTTLSRAADISVQRNPVVETTTVVSGTPPASTSYTLEISRGVAGEQRGVYEFPLPALPNGSTLTAASFNTYIGEFQSNPTTQPPTYPNVSFNGYAGDGVYSPADANVPLNPIGQTGPINVGGTQSYPLTRSYVQNLGGSSTHLGLMLYAQVQEYMAGFVRSGNYANIPQLGITATVPDSGTVNAKPLFDTLASFNAGGNNYILTDGGTSINTQYFAGAVDRRGVMEYDLGGVPHGATITSASITFNVDSFTNSPGVYAQPRVYGFAGNAVANSSDAQQATDLLGVGGPTTSLGSTTVTLDPAAIQALLASGDFVGINVVGSANGQQFGFSTTEGGFSTAPTLNIAYASVPEPTAVALLGSATVLLVGRRRRRALA